VEIAPAPLRRIDCLERGALLQLLLPFALAGGGQIAMFLERWLVFDQQEAGKHLVAMR
jgi:hypothetical protein